MFIDGVDLASLTERELRKKRSEIGMIFGIKDTLYMTLVSAFFGYVIGLPFGIVLNVTRKRRRTWRYRGQIRILQVADGHYDRNGITSHRDIQDNTKHMNQIFHET